MMLRRVLLLVIAMAWSLGSTPLVSQASALAAGNCQFILGFQTLHNLDPQDIGDCLDNQAFAANGDATQHTVNGLMAWRKADNWTAFTNGYWTWINGPYGLAKRLNTQRYSWEANPDGLPVVDEAGAIAPFTGSWIRHGFELNVRPDGTASASWRIYSWCGQGVPQPCDQIVNNQIIPGGTATAQFTHVTLGALYGAVSQTADPVTLAAGPVYLNFTSAGLLQINQGSTVITLCDPNNYDSSVCGA